MARLASKSLARHVDYVKSHNTDDNDKTKEESIGRFMQFIESVSPARNHSRCAGLFYRWHDPRSTDLDTITAAALALWYCSPHDLYRVNVHFDETYIVKGFKYTRDELTRELRKHGIVDFFVVFEVSVSKGKKKRTRLHCHAMAAIPHDINIGSLEQSLADRFVKDKQVRKELTVWGNKIVKIDRLEYAPDERKGPEYWASYALKDAALTKSILGWKDTHYISRGLVKPAKNIYNWMRKPSIDCFPFNPDAAPDMQRKPQYNFPPQIDSPIAVCDTSQPTDDADEEIDQILADFLNLPSVVDEFDPAPLNRLLAKVLSSEPQK